MMLRMVPCQRCGTGVEVEFTADSSQWNRLVRANGYPDYLCIRCFDGIAAAAGERYEVEFHWVGQAGVSVLARERDQRLAALEAALRDIAQAASEAADALAMHDPTTHSRLALQGCFEAIADAASAALEELHD